MIRVLSLGAGVQSSVVLLMSCKGELPKLDAVIFADTQWEPSGVYEHLPFLKEEAERAGIAFHVVTKGSLRQRMLDARPLAEGEKGTRFVSIPLYIRAPDGSAGMAIRHCTKEFKIEPVERCIRRDILGLKPRQRAPKGSVEHWFGISGDELRRVRQSDQAWEIKEYPLVGLPFAYLPKPYTRAMCVEWFTANYPGRPLPRSACIGCPYRSDAEWRSLQQRPKDWENAVDFDRHIRSLPGRFKGTGFLHSSLKPLDEVDLRTDEEHGQTRLPGFECMGPCAT